jgi:hypothetical protein
LPPGEAQLRRDRIAMAAPIPAPPFPEHGCINFPQNAVGRLRLIDKRERLDLTACTVCDTEFYIKNIA